MPQLYDTEIATATEYARQRAEHPDAIIPASGEPWVTSEHGGLKIYARDGQQRTGWYHQSGDVFILD